MKQRLYRVFLRGNIAGPYYVVASSPDAAYNLVVREFNLRDYGFTKDRVLDRVELIADTYLYADIPRLFIEPPYDDGK